MSVVLTVPLSEDGTGMVTQPFYNSLPDSGNVVFVQLVLQVVRSPTQLL